MPTWDLSPDSAPRQRSLHAFREGWGALATSQTPNLVPQPITPYTINNLLVVPEITCSWCWASSSRSRAFHAMKTFLWSVTCTTPIPSAPRMILLVDVTVGSHSGYAYMVLVHENP